MKKLLTLLMLVVMFATPMVLATEQPRCPEGSYAVGFNDPVAYANAVTKSGNVANAWKAKGMDDNKYAVIQPTNPDSFIVLDMGEGEEVWNMLSMDLQVRQDNSKDDNGVRVYVSNSPNSGWKYVGSSDGKGNDNFNIASSGYASIRYVKIVNVDRDTGRNDKAEKVEIDAVRGFCITQPKDDVDEVPEFGVVASLGILGLAGLFIYKRRQ